MVRERDVDDGAVEHRHAGAEDGGGDHRTTGRRPEPYAVGTAVNPEASVTTNTVSGTSPMKAALTSP